MPQRHRLNSTASEPKRYIFPTVEVYGHDRELLGVKIHNNIATQRDSFLLFSTLWCVLVEISRSPLVWFLRPLTEAQERTKG